jgi:hypothetical protein
MQARGKNQRENVRAWQGPLKRLKMNQGKHKSRQLLDICALSLVVRPSVIAIQISNILNRASTVIDGLCRGRCRAGCRTKSDEHRLGGCWWGSIGRCHGHDWPEICSFRTAGIGGNKMSLWASGWARQTAGAKQRRAVTVVFEGLQGCPKPPSYRQPSTSTVLSRHQAQPMSRIRHQERK